MQSKNSNPIDVLNTAVINIAIEQVRSDDT